MTRVYRGVAITCKPRRFRQLLRKYTFTVHVAFRLNIPRNFTLLSAAKRSAARPPWPACLAGEMADCCATKTTTTAAPLTRRETASTTTWHHRTTSQCWLWRPCQRTRGGRGRRRGCWKRYRRRPTGACRGQRRPLSLGTRREAGRWRGRRRRRETRGRRKRRGWTSDRQRLSHKNPFISLWYSARICSLANLRFANLQKTRIVPRLFSISDWF